MAIFQDIRDKLMADPENGENMRSQVIVTVLLIFRKYYARDICNVYLQDWG